VGSSRVFGAVPGVEVQGQNESPVLD